MVLIGIFSPITAVVVGATAALHALTYITAPTSVFVLVGVLTPPFLVGAVSGVLLGGVLAIAVLTAGVITGVIVLIAKSLLSVFTTLVL